MNEVMKNLALAGRLLMPLMACASASGSAASPAREYEVTAAGPEGQLAGSLIKAANGAPVVLIIPGSGPTDRNGNNPMGVTAASYKLLATAFADKGISTLRIDKRGMFGSDKAVVDANKVTISDYAADTRKWIDVGLKESGAKCIWLAGHSEGGLVALATAQIPERVCGVILLTSPGRNLADTVLEQLRANPANASFMPDAEKAIATLRAGKTVDVTAMHPALQGLFAPVVQSFWIDMFSYDPAALAAKVTLPMLIIQGGADIQVRASDAEALAKGQPKAKLLTIDSMTHVLKRADGPTPADSLATYSKAELPILPELVEAITAFVRP